MENLNTIEACFIATGRDPKVLPIVDHLPEKDQRKAIVDYQIPVIIEAINNSVGPDWKNWNEPKYYLWLDVDSDSSKPSGFGLSLGDVYSTLTFSIVGSRLTFRSTKGANFFWENYQSLLEESYL